MLLQKLIQNTNKKLKWKNIFWLIVNIKNTLNLCSADWTGVFSGLNDVGTLAAEVGVAARREADLVLGLVHADNALILSVWKFKEFINTMTNFYRKELNNRTSY